MRIDVVTIFPDVFPGPLGASIPGRALERGLATLAAHDMREWGLGRHRSVDDTPYGGGAGMVLRPEPIADALDALRGPETTAILLDPVGGTRREVDGLAPVLVGQRRNPAVQYCPGRGTSLQQPHQVVLLALEHTQGFRPVVALAHLLETEMMEDVPQGCGHRHVIFHDQDFHADGNRLLPSFFAAAGRVPSRRLSSALPGLACRFERTGFVSTTPRPGIDCETANLSAAAGLLPGVRDEAVSPETLA